MLDFFTWSFTFRASFFLKLLKLTFAYDKQENFNNFLVVTIVTKVCSGH